MSHFFDDANREIAIAARDCKDDGAAFYKAVKAIENKALRVVLLNTGDREFPEDLRQDAVGIVGVWALHYESTVPSEKGREYAMSLSLSKALELLHDLFHVLASRRIQTRFGGWSDNPDSNLARRDQKDGEDAPDLEIGIGGYPQSELIEMANRMVKLFAIENNGQNRIECIKYVRTLTNWNLREAKILVDTLWLKRIQQMGDHQLREAIHEILLDNGEGFINDAGVDEGVCARVTSEIYEKIKTWQAGK